MKYEPIKNYLGKFISRSPWQRKLFYTLIDILLLRSWHVRKALRRLSPLLPADASVLDAGSGLGQYAWRMIKRNRNWTIKGIDINSDQVEDCRQFFYRTGRDRSVTFETGDLTKLNDADRYNLVLTVDVMEHIADDELVFRNFYKALRSKGLLLISTPSDLGGSDAHSHDDDSFIDEHVRNGYGAGEITVKLKRAGFNDVRVTYTYGTAGSLSWILSMKYPVKLLNISYGFFILLPFYYVVILPVSLLLNYIDLYTAHKSGTGLLVVAEK
ncbi:MAG: class I SAM-dependent methyltransferase [Bacteroidales bacterium]